METIDSLVSPGYQWGSNRMPCCRGPQKLMHQVVLFLRETKQHLYIIHVYPHNPARADKSEDWGVWVDWPERLLPMWLETLGEQSRLHLRTCFFLRHGGIISEGGQLHPGQIQILACAYATIAQSSRQSLAMQHLFVCSSLSARECSPALDLESTIIFALGAW